MMLTFLREDRFFTAEPLCWCSHQMFVCVSVHSSAVYRSPSRKDTKPLIFNISDCGPFFWYLFPVPASVLFSFFPINRTILLYVAEIPVLLMWNVMNDDDEEELKKGLISSYFEVML